MHNCASGLRRGDERGCRPAAWAHGCCIPVLCAWISPASGAPRAQTVLGIILGGGAESRLYPLTKKRAKPAVPLGANYRLIDIPVSNCINSNVNKIYCLTQARPAAQPAPVPAGPVQALLMHRCAAVHWCAPLTVAVDRRRRAG